MADPLWTANATPTPWEPPSRFSIGYPCAGDEVTQRHPTHPGGHWFEAMTSEIRNVIVAAGLDFDPTDTTQLLSAIQILLGVAVTSPSYELREDGSIELREDGTYELRE